MAWTERGKQLIQKGSWVVFAIYIAVMGYFLFFSEALNRMGGTEYRYNLTLFQEIRRSLWYLRKGCFSYFFLNVGLNIAAFVPFGLILPVIRPKGARAGNVFLLSLGLTIGIEALQLIFRVGSFDVDDIVLNTLGGMLGYLLYVLGRRGLGRWRREERGSHA